MIEKHFQYDQLKKIKVYQVRLVQIYLENS